MYGTIRLVSPERGTALAAGHGRMVATSLDRGLTWEVRLLHAGREYYTRRPLGSEELASLIEGGPRAALPERWRWSAWGPGGESWLQPAERPVAIELVALAREALAAIENDELAAVDRFEVWLCERETEAPLALATTALSLESALAIPHLTPWTFTVPARQTQATREFQDRVNARLNRCQQPGRYRFAARIYERRSDRVIIRHGRKGQGRRLPATALPDGLLAEPWESERRTLARQPWAIEWPPRIAGLTTPIAPDGTIRLGQVTPAAGPRISPAPA